MRKALLLIFVVCIVLLLLCSCTENGNDTIPKTTTDAVPEETTTTSEITTIAEITTTAEATTTDTPVEFDKPTGWGGESKYVLMGLPQNVAVQQFAMVRVGSELNIFAAQRIGLTTYLSRCVVGSDGKTATKRDYIELEGYGHAESMDIAVNTDGSFYIYLGSHANPANSYAWATQITRLKYDNGKISDEKTISGTEYATADGSILYANATPYRINFAISPESDIMVFYISGDERCLVAYRFSELSAKLDAAETGISLKDCGSSFLAASKLTEKASDITQNGSFQGIEVDDKGDIYITGGGEDISPQLSRFVIDGRTIVRRKVTGINWIDSDKLGERNFLTSTSYFEIESIKCFEGELYCSFNPNGNLRANGTEVYLLIQK